MPIKPAEQAVRADFERYMSDEGQYPRAVARDAKGEYLLMQAASAWLVWRAAHMNALRRTLHLMHQAGRSVGVGGGAPVVARDIQSELESLRALGW